MFRIYSSRYLCLQYFACIMLGFPSILVHIAADDINMYFMREHSLVKPYQTTGISVPFWDFTGSVMLTHNFIILTPDLPTRTGIIWNKNPCKAKNWEMQIYFKIHGKSKNLFGDGMAIWYAKERMLLGPVFGNTDFFHGLGIFIDTYANQNGYHNHKHPYISAMINNGTLHYDHDRDGTHTELAGCHANLRNVDHDTHLSIRYERKILKVSTNIAGKNDWEECFSVKGVTLPTGYYFGISAATGDLSDSHEVISIKLFELDILDESDSNGEPAAEFFVPPREHVDPLPGMSGIKLFFIILCTLLGMLICIIGSVVAFQKNQDNRRKRLY